MVRCTSRKGRYFPFKGDPAEFLGTEKGLQKSLAVAKFCALHCEKRMSYRSIKLTVATVLLLPCWIIINTILRKYQSFGLNHNTTL